MEAWPVCVNPNRSNKIIGRESEEILRFLISAEVKDAMRRSGRRRGIRFLIFASAVEELVATVDGIWGIGGEKREE